MTMNINYTMRDIPSARSAYNAMLETNRAIDQTVDVLTSKVRINKAGDDAAGLAISERMRGEISGLDQAMTNIQDGMTMLQIAAGGIEEISQVVQKLRELAVQAANGTYTASDREALNAEFIEVRKEIDKVANTTVFNEKKLLNGDASALWSSSDLGLSVILNGAISESGDGGEETSAAGDYDITITARAGQAEVQKTRQFTTNYDEIINQHYELEGSAIYYDEDGNAIGINDAVSSFGALSDGTYTFNLVSTNDDGQTETLTVQTAISEGDFESPIEFVGFLNSEAGGDDTTLYGTDYEAYYNANTGRLGIKSSRNFKVNDTARGFQELFGRFKATSSAYSSYAEDEVPAGSAADGTTTLRELSNFYDAEGVFMFDIPQSLRINQGDGKTANVTLYADDTLDEAAQKLNDAIAYDLGQASYLGNAESAGNFARFIGADGFTQGTSESVAGTMLIRSALTGKAGELRFLGSQALLDALGLSTLQESKENEFNISIRKSDTEEPITRHEHVTGNRFKGAITQNVDIEFDRMTGIFTSWNDSTKKFSYSTASYDATLHLTDNSTNLQVGANEKERLRFTVADLSVKALNIEELDISDRQRATEAITSIDAAIDKVSLQNARTGVMINRLEQTYDTVSVLHEHAVESESRIRDADMAKMMMRFTNLKILADAQQGVFMQANQRANDLLSILR